MLSSTAAFSCVLGLLWASSLVFSDALPIEEYSVESSSTQQPSSLFVDDPPLDGQYDAALFWEEYENEINNEISSRDHHHHEVMISHETERRLANSCERKDPFESYMAKLYAVIGNAKGTLKTPEKKNSYGKTFKSSYNRYEKRRHKCIEIENVRVMDQLYETRPAPPEESAIYGTSKLRFSPRLYIKHSVTGRCRGCKKNEIMTLIMDDIAQVYKENNVQFKVTSFRRRLGHTQQIENTQKDFAHDQAAIAPTTLAKMVLEEFVDTDFDGLNCATYIDYFLVNPRCFGENFT